MFSLKTHWHFRDTWVSWVGIPIIALIMPLIFDYREEWDVKYTLANLLFSTVVTAFIWVGTHQLVESLSSRSEHMPKERYTRLSLLLLACSAYSVIVVIGLFKLLMLLIPAYEFLVNFETALFTSITITFIIIAIYQGLSYSNKFRYAFMRSEVLLRRNLRTKYESLKHQVNPYFLSNSLASLSQLLKTDKEAAVVYLQQLSAAYRYVLQSRDQKTVALQKELEFTTMYRSLLSIRYGKRLRISLEIDEEYAQCRIPPSTLQILVENAVKYNEGTDEEPLEVSVYNEEGSIIVYNNILKRQQVEDYVKIGLSNIRDRYKDLGGLKIIVEHTPLYFKVTVPLLPAKGKIKTAHEQATA